MEYEHLLRDFNIPTLTDRRYYLDMCTLYKMVNNLAFVPADFISPRIPHSHISLRSSKSTSLCQPHARTNTFLHSFIPRSCHAWNMLPTELTVLTPTHCLNLDLLTYNCLFMYLHFTVYFYFSLELFVYL